jgi:hypothetical protein
MRRIIVGAVLRPPVFVTSRMFLWPFADPSSFPRQFHGLHVCPEQSLGQVHGPPMSVTIISRAMSRSPCMAPSRALDSIMAPHFGRGLSLGPVRGPHISLGQVRGLCGRRGLPFSHFYDCGADFLLDTFGVSTGGADSSWELSRSPRMAPFAPWAVS